MKLRSIPWLIAALAIACQSSVRGANEPAVVTVPSGPPDPEGAPASQETSSPANPPANTDEERCDVAASSLGRTEGVVRVMMWEDGLCCMDGKPAREREAMTDEAARLVSLGVSSAVLIVDGSVPYGEVLAVMDALMKGGIGELSFSSASP